ncbi:hypothetical protein AK812_SmicGene25928 [Symbiodinium microadriaticum]|uniref:Uncharacterized protein n=1 Tax=Symbiodinium microadriaticum TaxID=2951 RepID=A0A1Q9DAY1_SYMMI|nr:hypothetical protein AK812_SmicGene25928 [Symbiodinium microadriaticum]
MVRAATSSSLIRLEIASGSQDPDQARHQLSAATSASNRTKNLGRLHVPEDDPIGEDSARRADLVEVEGKGCSSKSVAAATDCRGSPLLCRPEPRPLEAYLCPFLAYFRKIVPNSRPQFPSLPDEANDELSVAELTSAISSYGRGGAAKALRTSPFVKAVAWLQNLQRAQLQPSVITYNSLINACGSKQWRKVKPGRLAKAAREKAGLDRKGPRAPTSEEKDAPHALADEVYEEETPMKLWEVVQAENDGVMDCEEEMFTDLAEAIIPVGDRTWCPEEAARNAKLALEEAEMAAADAESYLMELDMLLKKDIGV